MDEIEQNTGSGDRRDELISRVIDGEASERDWMALRALAEADPTVWTDLTKTQAQHEALCALVDEVGLIADDVELPVGPLLTPVEHFERRMAGVRTWGGWAAAAAVLLVWFTGLPSPTAGDRTQTGGVGNIGDVFPKTPEGILDRYMEAGQKSGQVLGQMPQRVVLETRPIAGGDGVEVVYLRQIIEKQVVSSTMSYRLGRDEFGQTTLVPNTQPVRPQSSY
ncbi:MAG: hypothetical protein H6810_05105 [Phycisphaeraceae bacterium]|nr:MAG: hypothetical protein H6810_05105 [Phycisphaeraceae bacterium]